MVLNFFHNLWLLKELPTSFATVSGYSETTIDETVFRSCGTLFAFSFSLLFPFFLLIIPILFELFFNSLLSLLCYGSLCQHAVNRFPNDIEVFYSLKNRALYWCVPVAVRNDFLSTKIFFPVSVFLR